MNQIKDNALYRELSIPFPDADTANAALTAFYEELRELRIKHKLADVLTVVMVTVKYDEGEGQAFSSTHNGDAMKAESLAAWAYGRYQADRRELINKLLLSKK